ncbi:Uncharacterized conserved protein PhnB, glyoxalase superfamily [Pseudonocardia thermophila]|uniref:Uncharacterized conserved protein PhnB, glyoxalase superfamily n=1 Tax=Pseudonocardia thermophila TaxID=1848 RepID=A0A1M6PJ82_PSETH|nr:VOC family protein [Pseudonocardia thermophila]SHK07989.1 Uncharacterized conserved protein PhnB, glyoxalase superfamily [Pseudonocardia thermophila]
MTSPFDELRAPIVPVDPDPAFAAALRARLERAVLEPGSETAMTTAVPTRAVPDVLPSSTVRPRTLTPYLRVRDSRAAVAFYVAAFRAVPQGPEHLREDGRIAHVEVVIGDSVLMIADSNPEIDLLSPAERGGPTGSVRIEVPDADAAFSRALAAGATVERPVGPEPYGRGGVVLDDSGNRIMIVQAEPVLEAGDLTHASLRVPDAERAARFFGAVLGWATQRDHDGAGIRVANLPSHLGIWSAAGRPTLFCCYAVPDVATAVAAVRAAGGTAQEPARTPYGLLADCVDDQGVPFAVNEAVGDPAAGPAPGAITSVELRAPDPIRARAFYSAALGVHHRPGSGGWRAHRGDAPLRPASAITEGPVATVVPRFLVVDLEAATAAVVAAGGQVEALRETGAECVDDQGLAFGLTTA